MAVPPFYQLPLFALEKRCKLCNATKPIEHFGIKQKMRDGHRNECRACVAERSRAWNRTHPGYYIAWQKAHPDHHREWYRAAAARDPERFRRQRRERNQTEEAHIKARAQGLAWRRKNPERFAHIRRQREMRKRGAEGNYTLDEIRSLEISQEGRCYYCKRLYGRYERDHKQPLSRGGTNYISNIALTCRYCNRAKNDKTEAEYQAWLARCGLLRF